MATSKTSRFQLLRSYKHLALSTLSDRLVKPPAAA